MNPDPEIMQTEVPLENQRFSKTQNMYIFFRLISSNNFTLKRICY